MHGRDGFGEGGGFGEEGQCSGGRVVLTIVVEGGQPLKPSHMIYGLGINAGLSQLC